MEETLRNDVAIDDVIVGLHTHGETVFQAMARASALPGVDRSTQRS